MPLRPIFLLTPEGAYRNGGRVVTDAGESDAARPFLPAADIHWVCGVQSGQAGRGLPRKRSVSCLLTAPRSAQAKRHCPVAQCRFNAVKLSPAALIWHCRSDFSWYHIDVRRILNPLEDRRSGHANTS